MTTEKNPVLDAVTTASPSLNEILVKELNGYESPELILKTAIELWLANEPHRHRPNLLLAVKVQEKIEKEDIMGALLVLAEERGEIALTDSGPRTLKRIKKQVKAVMSGATVFETGRASTTLKLGGASHDLMEKTLAADSMGDILNDDYNLVVSEGWVIGLIEKTPPSLGDNVSQPELMYEGHTLGKPPHVHGVAPAEAIHQPKVIQFQFPFKKPKDLESRAEWGSKALEACLNMVVYHTKTLPQKKYDVAQVFKNPQALKALVQALEISHYLFGTDHDLSLVNWQDGKGVITAEKIKEFPVLDWLTVQRTFIERAKGKTIVEGRGAVLVEIPDGRMRVMGVNGNGQNENGELIEAKKIDMLKLSWKSERDELEPLRDRLKDSPRLSYVLTGELSDRILDPGARGDHLNQQKFYDKTANSEDARHILNGEFKELFLDLVGGADEPDFTKLSPGNYGYARALLKYAAAYSKYKSNIHYLADKDSDIEFVSLWQTKLENEIRLGRLDLSLSDAVKQIQSKFNSQESKYRRKGTNKHGKDVEVSTRNSRNIRNLFKELYKIYGDRIFTDLVIEIDDLKFPAGDGGWFTQFNEDNLPLPEHATQVASYLFRVMSQLYWVERWAKQNILPNENIGAQVESQPSKPVDIFDSKDGEHQAIKIEDVADFIVRRGLYNRIAGHLRYQNPANENIKNIMLDMDKEALINWGTKAFKLDNGKKDIRPIIRIRRAIHRVLKPQIEKLILVQREVKKMPDYFKNICLEDEAGVLLCVDKLESYLRERLTSGKARISNAASFKDQEVNVFWVENFSDEIPFLKIAVDRNGMFSMYGMREWREKTESGKEGLNTEGISVRGRLLTVFKNFGIDENRQDRISAFERGIWNRLGQQWKLEVKFGSVSKKIKAPVQAQDMLVTGDNESQVFLVYPDGSMPKKIKDKPRVTTWDPMGPSILRLDMTLLAAVNEASSDKSDRWGYRELQNILAEQIETGLISEHQILCPSEAHGNERTKAARLYGDHITCFREHIKIALPEMGPKVERVPTTVGTEVFDYNPVSPDRERAIRTFMEAAQIIARNSELPRAYLENERGLSPTDLSNSGYIPLELDHALTSFLLTDTYRTQSKGGADRRLDQIGVWLARQEIEPDPRAMEACKMVFSVIDALPFDEREKVIKSLNLGSLGALRRRHILEARRNKDGVEVIKNRIGGRIISPTFWVSGKKSGFESLVASNINARGIKIGNIEYYAHPDEPHHKAILNKTSKMKEGTSLKLRSTPVGFWFSDPRLFLQNVDETVFVFEGPLNQPSFGRLIGATHPEYKAISLTNVGLGHRELIAFLKWLGVVNGDSSVMGKRIKYLVYATDIDDPGVEAFYRNKARFEREFEGLQVLPIHDFLPADVKEVLPPLDPKLFEEGGKFEGFEIDMNDLLRKHPEDWTFGMEVNDKNRDLIEAMRFKVEQLRQKYAYIPS